MLFFEKNIEDKAHIAIWQTEEVYSYFYEQIVKLAGTGMAKKVEDEIRGIHLEKRKFEWLVIRFLLYRHLASISESEIYDYEIRYDNHRKPHVFQESQNRQSKYLISISHSKDLIGIILSDKFNVGLDIEFMTDKILNIANKFISQNELATIPKDNYRWGLYVFWSAKEALFKLHGRQNLSFKENIEVHLPTNKNREIFKGFIKTNDFCHSYRLHQQIIENNMIVWSIEE